MKQKSIMYLAVCALLAFSPVQALAQDINPTVSATKEQASLPERYLAYGKITDITYEDDKVTSITAEDLKGEAVIYNLDENTVIFDSGKGTILDISTLSKGEGVYFYHSPAMTASIPPQTYAEAIVANTPMDTSCAHLHRIEAVEETETGINITTDNGSLIISAEKDLKITDINGNKLDEYSFVAGDRFFTWYDAAITSYPSYAGVNRIVVIAQEDAETYSSPAKVSYDINDVINKNNKYYVPLRDTADALGISVDWNKDTRTATISNDTRTMDIAEGKDLYISATTIENAVGMTAPLKLDAAPFIDENGKMQVPAEAFNALVGYNVTIDENTVTISEQ